MTQTIRKLQIHPADIEWVGVLDFRADLGKYLFWGSIALLILGFAACASTPATETPAAKFKISYTCLDRDLDGCIFAKEFAQRVYHRSNGQVDIRITSPAEMVIPRRLLPHLMEEGSLGMVEVYHGDLGGKLPILEMGNLWGMYQDYDTQMKVTEAIRDDMDRIVEEKFGVVVLAYQFYPGNYIFAKKPLRTSADVKGLIIRSPSPMVSDLLLGMGADVRSTLFRDVHDELKEEKLDAAVSCGSCGAGLRWSELTDYLVGPIVALPHTWITMNETKWAELPPDLQTIILEEAKRHEEKTKRNSLTIWNGLLETKGAGMEHIEFSPELKGLAKEAVLTRVLPNWVIQTGGANTKASKIYNEKLAPILKVEITAEGEARKLK